MGGGILLIRKVCVFMEKENNRNDKCNKCNKFNNRVKYILLVLFGSAFICAAFFIKYMFYSEPYEGYDMTDYVALPDYGEIIEANSSDNMTDEEKSDILQEIIIQTEILNYPEKETAKWKKLYDEYYRGLAEDYQAEDFTAFISEMLGMSESEYEEFLEAEARHTVAEELCIYSLAEETEVEVSDQEYRQFLNGILEQFNMTEEEFRDSYGKSITEYGEENGIRTQLLKEKVINELFGGKGE